MEFKSNHLDWLFSKVHIKIAAITLILALWKLVDIIVWLVSHLQVSVV